MLPISGTARIPKSWGNPIPNEDGHVDTSFDMAVHYFYDDTNIAGDAYSYITDVFYSPKEAELFDELCNSIDKLLGIYGDIEGHQYVEKPEWGHVVLSAQLLEVNCAPSSLHVFVESFVLN